MTIQEWLGEDNLIGQDIWEKKYRYNNETFEGWLDRVSGNNKELRELIKERKFLFGGRSLANRGTSRKGSFFNCYSNGYCPDDINGIMKCNTELALTYKAQGGQGVSLTKIRPKGTPIGSDYVSDGIIPFMEMFNTTTASISQGGSRKGALMMSIDIRHKEAPTFITIKSNEDKITKANLSLEIDDEFMSAVQTYFLAGEKITLHESRNYNGHKVEYDIVPIELYNLMIQTVYDWGEPGCIFTNRFRNYNLMQHDDDYEIVTCNPCGEQPLKSKSSCNLGSINLSEFIKNPYTDKAEFDWEEFNRATAIGVRALDTIIDENLTRHALKEQAENSKNYRNIGLGVFGYANALFKLKLKYGSEASKKFTDKLFNEMFYSALDASAELAKENGSFPKCKIDKILQAEILEPYKKTDVYEKISKYGLRNCSLLSIAPTGSIATMLGCSGGCEPEFALSYKRRTENLKESYDVYCKSVKEYCNITGNSIDNLPDYFVSSEQINWKDRIEIQSIMQNWVDTAISSTINLAEDISIEEVSQIYLNAWSKGLKGITIFRSGCKRAGILTTAKEDKKEEKVKLSAYTKESDLPWGSVLCVDNDLVGMKRKITNGCGAFHLQAFYDEVDGRIWETFISLGDGGGCERNLEFISKLISKCLRAGVSIDEVIETAKSIRPCMSYCNRARSKSDTSPGVSCPSAIGKALEDFKAKITDLMCEESDLEYDDYDIDNFKSEQKEISTENICPECGAPLNKEGGCDVCHNCGYSHCG